MCFTKAAVGHRILLYCQIWATLKNLETLSSVSHSTVASPPQLHVWDFCGNFFFRLAAMVCHNESPHVKRHNGPRKKRHSESSKLWKTVSFTVFTLIVFIGYATPGYCMCCIKKNIFQQYKQAHLRKMIRTRSERR